MICIFTRMSDSAENIISTTIIMPRKIDINNIGRNSKRRIRKYVSDMMGFKTNKNNLIKIAADMGLDVGFRSATKEKRVYKFFGEMMNEQMLRKIEMEKKEKDRTKKISQALRMQQIAQPIDSAFRGKFEVYRLPLNLDIPESKQEDKNYVRKMLERKIKKQLKIFEIRFRGRPLKLSYGLQYLGFSETKDEGQAHMSEIRRIAPAFHWPL